MANVLPPQFKKSLWRVQRAHYALVFAIMLGILVVVGAVALAPSYLALEIASPRVPEIPENTQREVTDPLALARANALVTNLMAATHATSSPSELFAMIFDASTSEIVVDSISLTESGSRIAVSGTGSREGISAYRNILSENDLFSSVSVPVGALVGSENSRFSITITLR